MAVVWLFSFLYNAKLFEATRMKYTLLFTLLWIHCQAGVMDHCRTLKHKLGSSGMRQIDYIYLINLDQRPERWVKCLNQLIPYDICPERFPGIYGWSISPVELNGMALTFQPGMWTGPESVMHFPLHEDGTPRWAWLSEAFYGRGCFSGWTVKGTIGCSLSHFSVLKDAYDCGYKTVWVLEDDFVIHSDPHQLSDLIEELDGLVGADGWDVLYTDYSVLSADGEIPAFYWRPDMPYRNVKFLAEHQDLGEHFIKIGSRMRLHSTIYSRSGIERIVHFYQTRGNFLPFDCEIALIPGIRLFTLKQDIVSVREETSDTRARYFH